MKAMISGSFDPVTRGHEDLIRRAAALFDRVEVVIFRNTKKHALFPTEQRLAFLRTVCADLPNVTVTASDGTVAGYTRENGIDCVIKGVRDGGDLAYEQDMAHLNRLAGGAETLLLPTDPALSFVSSGAVREFLLRGLPAAKMLPASVADAVLRAYAALPGSRDR